jgi:hypothetical protein
MTASASTPETQSGASELIVSGLKIASAALSR